MALIDTLRQKYPDYSDDEILGALKATKYPDYSIDEIGKAVGYNPSDLGRGFKESFQQLPQLGYGALAGIGAAGETMLGEGGIMSGLKRAGVQGFQDWGDKIASGARESDSFSYSYDQAKEGNFGALVDWLQHGLGYVGGQGLQALASAGIGAVGGKMALGAAAQQIAKGMVLKEAAVIGATAEGKALAKDALIAQATQNVASKLGQTAAVGALAVGQEGGEIFGDLASQSVKEGRTLTGDELAKAFGATLAAGGLEFVGDKLGLDIIMGKSRIGNKLMGMAGEAPGLGGKLARGAMAGAAAVPAEAGTEYFQTGIEEFGKGTEANPLPWNQSEENQRQAFDAAALGAIGGGAIGAGGGLMSRATQIADAPDPVEATQRLATAGTVDEMVKAANDIAMAPLTPAVRPRQANESTINEIRSLGDPALEQEALGLMATAASRSAAPGQRAEPTPDQRLAAAAAQAPKIQPGDLLTADGQPYGTRAGAAVRATREGGGEVIQVPGGYVVRKESPGEPVTDLAGAAAVPAAPADGLGNQPGGSVGAVRPDPAATPERAPAPAEAPSSGSGSAVPVGAGPEGVPGALSGGSQFDPQGLKPGTPEYDAAFTSWSDKRAQAKAAGEIARQRGENQTAIDKRNAWRKRVRDWFLAAKDGDTITDTGTGTKYRVVVKKRANGQTIKSLVAVDDSGQPLSDGRAATGIGMVDDRVDGLDDASLDQDTGSTTPETAGASLAASLGQLLESGEAATSGPTPAPSLKDRVDAKRKDAAAPADQTAPPQGRAPEAAAPREAFEHAGLKVYPGRVRVGDKVEDRWAVQLPENKATGKVLGDTLHATREEAMTAAEREVARFERDQRNRAEQDAAEAARKAEEEARKSANRGKSIKERAAAAQLDKPTKLPPQAGLGRGTRRESMDKAIEQGRAVVEVQVEDTAAKNADKKAVDAVSKAGYLLSLSNENIPVVKAGLAARDRLKAGKYDKPEYRVYGGSRQEGPFYEVTKTEYDYAQSLKSAPSSPEPAVSQSGETAPASETAPPKPKRPPKSFRKKVTVTTDVYVEEAGRFEQRETDADTALKALDEDVAELERLRKCLGG